MGRETIVKGFHVFVSGQNSQDTKTEQRRHKQVSRAARAAVKRTLLQSRGCVAAEKHVSALGTFSKLGITWVTNRTSLAQRKIIKTMLPDHYAKILKIKVDFGV